MKRIVYFSLVFVIAVMLAGCTLSQQANRGASPANAQPEVEVNQLVPAAEGAVEVAAVVAAQSGTVIKVEPASTTLNNGETVKINIVIENVSNLIGADVALTFNPAVLQAQDGDAAKDGLQVEVGPFLSPDFVIANTIDNATGTAQYALTQLPTSNPASGTGVIASITFEAIANGTSDLTLTKTDLPSDQAQPISADVQNGQVQVGDGGGGEPTATPMPATETPTGPTDTPVPPTNTPVVPPTNTPVVPPTNTPVVPPTNTPVVPPTATPTTPPGGPTMPPPTSVPPPPVPPVGNIPPGATVGFCYRVQPGDTLFGIGQRFGIDHRDITLVNDLWPPDHIYAYQALFIPEQLGRGPNFYIVRSGDSLENIAQQCHLPVRFLAKANGLSEFAVLSPGHVLRIPIPPFPPASKPGSGAYPYRGPVNDDCCPSCRPIPPPYTGPYYTGNPTSCGPRTY